MNAPSKDIATILGNESSLALTVGEDLFYGRMPATPANVVALEDLPGTPPLLTLQQNTSDYFIAGINIRVRNNKYDTGYGKAKELLDFLHGLSNVDVGTTKYLLIRAINDIDLLYYDDNDRPNFSINFEVQRRLIV